MNMVAGENGKWSLYVRTAHETQKLCDHRTSAVDVHIEMMQLLW